MPRLWRVIWFRAAGRVGAVLLGALVVVALLAPPFLPDPRAMPPGCAFAPRCALADDHCRSAPPPLADHGGSHLAACFKAGQAA